MKAQICLDKVMTTESRHHPSDSERIPRLSLAPFVTTQLAPLVEAVFFCCGRAHLYCDGLVAPHSCLHTEIHGLLLLLDDLLKLFLHLLGCSVLDLRFTGINW